MRRFFTFLSVCAAFVASLCAADGADYTEGVFILNEDWFGHQNSTINYLTEDGEWVYSVFQKENPGRELGGTADFGAVFDGRLYIVAKQDKDPAATKTGGRLTVCDARTMKCVKQLANIAVDADGNSVADGRAFVGITPKKGYVSTSNGIYVLDLTDIEVTGIIPGTGGGKGLYSDQCGMMVYPDGAYVYAVHQEKGLMVIDAETDTLVRTIAAPVDSVDGKAKVRGFGALVRSKDGDLWLSVAANVNGNGVTADYIMRYDIETGDTVRVSVPGGCGAPSSWYAWTADAMCASAVENKLYWKRSDPKSWFTNSIICCYDIDKGEFNPTFFDTQSIGWYLYCGAAFRLHPKSDEMYCTLYQGNQSQLYLTLRLSNCGEIVEQYDMIDNYWFPAMPIFPEESGEGGGETSVDNVSDSEAQVWYDATSRSVVITSVAERYAEVYSIGGTKVCGEYISGEKEISAAGWMKGVYVVRMDGEVYKVMVY